MKYNKHIKSGWNGCTHWDSHPLLWFKRAKTSLAKTSRVNKPKCTTSHMQAYALVGSHLIKKSINGCCREQENLLEMGHFCITFAFWYSDLCRAKDFSCSVKENRSTVLEMPWLQNSLWRLHHQNAVKELLVYPD